MSDKKSLLEIVLMPAVVAVIGIGGTFVISKYETENMMLREDAEFTRNQALAERQRESDANKARSDKELKIIDIFSQEMLSDDAKVRRRALKLLNALDSEFAVQVSEAIQGNDNEEMDIRKSACVLKKEREYGIREERIEYPLSAGKGKLLTCRTQKTANIVRGKGPEFDEKVWGDPICEITEARIPDRATITVCGIENGKIPVLGGKVRGKGCTEDNSATFVLIQKYKRIPDKKAKESIVKECELELASN